MSTWVDMIVFLGNKKAPIGAIHQFSNNDVEDDIAKTNVEPLWISDVVLAGKIPNIPNNINPVFKVTILV